MKSLYILLALFITSIKLNAQIVDIPDPILKNRLVDINSNCVDTNGDGSGDTNADFNGDGEIQVSEAEAVTGLYLTTYNSNTFSSPVGLEAFVNLETLEFNGNSVSTFNASVYPNLKELNCSNNDLTTLNLTGLSNLEELRCGNNELSALDISDLTNLNYFNCIGNQLNQLDLSGLVNLVEILCNSNLLTAIDISSLQNLVELQCTDNQLTILDISGLVNLDDLRCQNNLMTSLNSGNSSNLTYLNCAGNQFTSFDFSGLTNLTYFNCNDNLFSSIDVSSLVNLEDLYCDNNQLTTLDVSALTTLEKLYCSNNELTTIDLSNQTELRVLWCRYNNLTEIDLSNNALLSTIQISNNFLTSLDLSNNRGQTINCANNLLEYLNVKNGRLTTSTDIPEINTTYTFNFSANPTLNYICADDEIFQVFYEFDEIQNIQTYIGFYGYTNCFVNSYCSFVPGGTYYTIEGNTSIDIDFNGCDAADPIYPNLRFSITDGSNTGTLTSNSSGAYSIPIQGGNHTITPVLENLPYYNAMPASLSVDFPSDSSPVIQDFCIVPTGVFNDLEIIIVPLTSARPGFDTNYKIVYKNKGTTTLSGDIDFGFQDTLMDYVTATPPNESGLTDLLSWSFTDLTPFESREIELTMNINSPMDTPPVNGDDVLMFDASVNSSETDETPDDNTFQLNQTVVNSFDPNDKTCLEGDFITPEMVGDYVHYMIRFENTGTASAINVVVKDNIDRTKYDLSSLIALDASHDFVARIKDDGSDYYVEFIFENINLPFDDANNDGYVVFKIKTLDTLVLGDTFENNAEIYFDFNFPIITNFAETSIATLSTEDFELANNAISLYPNPTTNTLTLESKQAIQHITIYDISGRSIKEIAVIGVKTELTTSTETLSTGTYFVKIKTDSSEVVKKIIKD